MVTIASFAIGDIYEEELSHMVESCQQHSPSCDMIVGTGATGSNVMRFNFYRDGEDRGFVYEAEIDTAPEDISNWNNIGFVKAWFIKACFKLCDICPRGIKDDYLLWLDADARVRGDLECLWQEMDEPVGMVKRADFFINGTIGLKNTPEVRDWISRWWERCKQRMSPNHTEWLVNDQTVLRQMIVDGDHPGISDLGERWASLPPDLVGSKANPPIVKPPDADALVWHWQASRATMKGWNWPPAEEIRPK